MRGGVSGADWPSTTRTAGPDIVSVVSTDVAGEAIKGEAHVTGVAVDGVTTRVGAVSVGGGRPKVESSGASSLGLAKAVPTAASEAPLPGPSTAMESAPCEHCSYTRRTSEGSAAAQSSLFTATAEDGGDDRELWNIGWEVPALHGAPCWLGKWLWTTSLRLWNTGEDGAGYGDPRDSVPARSSPLDGSSG